MFVIGVLLFAGASLAGGFATGEVWLIAARALQGVGAAIASPTAFVVALVVIRGRSHGRGDREVAASGPRTAEVCAEAA